MIHIVTNHHETIKWLEPQAKYLKKHTNDNYKIYSGFTDMNEEVNLEEVKQSSSIFDMYEFDELKEVANDPPYKFDYLANSISMEENNKDDLLIFLDPDAFPIQLDWDLQVKTWLKDRAAIAISREENLEPLLKEDQSPYPHPCFFVTTLGFWRENNLSWRHDPSQGIECAGILLKKWFEDNDHQWGRMLRTNCFNLHPLNFGVYGQLIYHHGSGNRPVYDSIDIWARPELSKKYGVSLDLYYPELLEFNQKISDVVFSEINKDPNFIRMYFCGQDRI
jgi:hypothetical protein